MLLLFRHHFASSNENLVTGEEDLEIWFFFSMSAVGQEPIRSLDPSRSFRTNAIEICTTQLEIFSHWMTGVNENATLASSVGKAYFDVVGPPCVKKEVGIYCSKRHWTTLWYEIVGHKRSWIVWHCRGRIGSWKAYLQDGIGFVIRGILVAVDTTVAYFQDVMKS